MAKLKDRAQITRRDPDFSRRLEVVKTSIETTPKPAPAQTKQDSAIPDTNKPTIEPSTPVEMSNAAELKPVKKPSSSNEGKARQRSKTSPSRQDVKASLSKKTAASADGKDEKMRLRFGFRFPDELVQRAEAWAEKARCPVSAILRKSFGELRPILIETLERGIKYTEIPHDRVTDASASFDTSIMIDKNAYEKLVMEIDPEGMTGIEAPMSRWARVKFIEHFESYLEKNGY